MVHDLAAKGIGLMRVEGELDLADRTEFLAGLDKLLQTGRIQLVIDMTPVRVLSSLFIGTLIDFGARALREKRKASVLLVPRAAEVCRMIGLDKVMQVVVRPVAP